jgi:predicted phage terminase large subunit-like protein
MFKPERLAVLEVAPQVLRRVRRWDLAAGTEEDDDWTAVVLMGITAKQQYVIFDVIRLHGNVDDVDAAIFNAAVQDGRGTMIRIEQEGGSSGKRVVGDFVRRLRGYDVRGEPSTGSKELRARPLSAQWHAGNVMAVRGAWLTDYVDEMKVFPNPSAHDDQVDASSGAFTDLTFSRAGRLRAYG